MKVVFVLVEPERPGNIGASARALHTMGFDTLRLVNPCPYQEGEAQWLAYGSRELLARAEVFQTLPEALADIDLVVGTSARTRRYKFAFQTCRQLPDLLDAKGASVNRAAIVFGRESSGLSNAALELCDFVSTIPVATTYPSLNLAQAVMTYAYELSRFTQLQASALTGAPIPMRQVEYHHLKSMAGDLLQRLGIDPRRPEYRQILERFALLNQDDLHLVQLLRRHILEALELMPASKTTGD